MRKILFLLILSGLALSMTAQVVDTRTNPGASNPNQVIGKAIKSSGIVSLSVGVPCVAAGIAGLLYANFMPNPVAGYTTSKVQAEQYSDLEYMPTNEYIAKMQDYNGKMKAIENAGYILTGAGAALTIVGIPLYCSGKKIMELQVNYVGNGAGLALNF